MKNYINFEGQEIALTDEQIAQLRAVLETGAHEKGIELASIEVGETFKLGAHEFIVLEHTDDTTAVILKSLLYDSEEFGKNNNYADSNVDRLCNEFAEKVADIVGKENLIEHEVDLTSDDGLKDYGTATRRMSLITADMYRKHVDTLDKHKIDAWWWLSTPFSTPRHEASDWVKCVSPLGFIDFSRYYYVRGVRPFCILNSNIFVSR